MWLRKFTARDLFNGYYFLLTGDRKNLEDDTDKKKVKGISELNFINKIAYNDLIVSQ